MCTLYERIILLCERNGVSGSRMCLDLGLSKSTLSNMKSGRTSGLSATTAQKIASYFGVSVGYLLGEEENNNTATTSEISEGEAALLELFRSIPENEQERVLAMIRAALGKNL